MKLNGIELLGLVIDNNLQFSGVRADVTKTLEGGMVIWEQKEFTGETITLVGGDRWGCLQYEVLKQIFELSKVVGGRYILETEVNDLLVRFRHESPPVIDASPIVSVPNPSNTDWYNNIVIKLMVD